MFSSSTCFGKIHLLDAGKRARKLMHYAACLQKFNPVLYVDCANSFDPYLVYRKSGKDPESLDRIFVVRPFTLYQLRDLVQNKLEEKILDSNSKTLLVSHPDTFGLDHAFEKPEYEHVTREITEKIKELTKKHTLFTVMAMKDN